MDYLDKMLLNAERDGMAEERERHAYNQAHGCPDEIELVPWDSRCPRCDEQRMDWLVWVSIEGDKVECMTCKATYTP